MIPSVSSYNTMHHTGDIPARKIMMVTMRHGTSHDSSKKQPFRTLLRRIFKGFIHHDVTVATKLTPTTEKDVPVLTFINDASEEGDFVTVVPLARRKRMTSGPCILCTAVLDYPMESSKLQRQGARRREASRALRVIHRHPSQGYYSPNRLKPSDSLLVPGDADHHHHHHLSTDNTFWNQQQPSTEKTTPIYTSLMAQITADDNMRTGELTTTSLMTTDETTHVESLPVLGVRQRRSSAWDRFLDGSRPVIKTTTTTTTTTASTNGNRRKRKSRSSSHKLDNSELHRVPIKNHINHSSVHSPDDCRVHPVTLGGIERLLIHRSHHHPHPHHTGTATPPTNMTGVTSFPVSRTVSAHVLGRSPCNTTTTTAMATTALRRMSAIGLEIMTPLRPITTGGHKVNVVPLQKMEQIDDEYTSQSSSGSSGSSANNSLQTTESENDTDE